MALQNEAWFIHAVDENVTHLAQQKPSKIMGSVRMKTGITGKTCPFQILADIAMTPAVRDADTTYLNPAQTKRRAILKDMNAAVLIDEFDELRTMTDPQSEFAQALAYARNRELDRFVLSQPLVGGSGGALGNATTVDEAAETSGSVALPGAQQIAAGGAGLTMTKVREAKLRLDNFDVEEEDRYAWVSPEGMQDLLSDTTVTSSDFNSIKALVEGRLPQDQTWMGFKWRMSTLLPLLGNVRTCIFYQKMAVGLAVGVMKSVEASNAPHKWNNPQVIVKLSAGAVRIDDRRLVSVDIDESV